MIVKVKRKKPVVKRTRTYQKPNITAKEIHTGRRYGYVPYNKLSAQFQGKTVKDVETFINVGLDNTAIKEELKRSQEKYFAEC